jgi:hypothetical protein
MDPQNFEDGIIFVNYNQFTLGFLEDTFEQKHIEKLRSILTHEIIHAKDPNFNHKQSGFYSPETNKIVKNKEKNIEYHQRVEEIKAFTGQFIDLIENRIDTYIEKNSDKIDKIKQSELDTIEKILNSFLSLFCFKLENTINNLSKTMNDFIESFQLNIKNIEDINRKMTWQEREEEYEKEYKYLNSKVLYNTLWAIRSFSDKDELRYKNFQKTIYKSISDCIDKINKMIKNSDLKPIKIKNN